jgi:hypothetical protein
MAGAAAGRVASGQDGVRDVASLGDVTPEALRKTFPDWRIFNSGGVWWAARRGVQEWIGPESLLLRVICAADLTALAEKLCLQEWLDALSPDKLAAVYRDMTLPEESG